MQCMVNEMRPNRMNERVSERASEQAKVNGMYDGEKWEIFHKMGSDGGDGQKK